MARGSSFYPSATRDTFRDVLIFEERLKQNAERLQKQRRKYEAFLVCLVLIILYLFYRAFLSPSKYSLVHYGNVASLLVSLVTLALFFATGMYSEQISLAYKFVPQTNRALRPFNIYLNTRSRPSRFSLFSLFRPAPITTSLPGLSSSHPAPLSRRASSSSSHSSTSSRSSRGDRSPPPGSPVLQARLPLPPASNPRGELIFSTRVSPTFREGYERYRGEWERRRGGAEEESRWGNITNWIGGLKGESRAGSASGSISGAASGVDKDREGSAETEGEKRGRRSPSITSTPPSRQGSPLRVTKGRTHRASPSPPPLASQAEG